MESSRGLEERISELEGAMSARDELNPQLNDISEALTLIRRVLSDLTDAQPNSEEFADDLERLDTLAGLLP